MKKIFIGVFVVAAMASCSKNEVAESLSPSNTISFNTLNNKLTRAATSKDDDYMVYAKSTVTGENDWFINTTFNGSEPNVDKPKNGSQYYWPASPATVSFWAFAPAKAVTNSNAVVTADHDNGTLKIDYTVPADGQEDFTIATPVTNKKDGTVNFMFNHVLSQVTIEAEMTKTMSDAGYTVSFASADFHVAQNQGSINATDPTQAWTLAATPTAATYTSKKSYMFMPQSTVPANGAITVQLKGVTIMKSGATVFSGDMQAYTIATGDVAGDNFLQGKNYKLKLTINGSAHDDGGNPAFGSEITFSSDFTPWTDEAVDKTQP